MKLFFYESSERKSHSEVEGKITTQSWMNNGEMFFIISLICRINGFHSQIEPEDKIVEIQTQTKTVAHSQVLQQSGELKLSAGLLFIVGPRLLTLHPRTLFAPPEKYRFSKGRMLLLP